VTKLGHIEKLRNGGTNMRSLTDHELARIGGGIALAALVALGAYIILGG